MRLAGVKHIKVDSAAASEDGVAVRLHSTMTSCACPDCGTRSRRVHSRYDRTLMSLPILGNTVTLTFSARRFHCDNDGCARKVFSEQAEGLTERHSRVTAGCRRVMENVLVEVSAEKGSKILEAIGTPRSPSTCLRIVKWKPLPDIDPLSVRRVLVDDFAFRKGQTYGTIVMDADTKRVLDIVEGRSSEAAATILKKYPNVEVISRDRSGAYSLAAEKAHPGAAQVADRFHVVKNCGDNLAEQLKASLKAIAGEVAEVVGGDITIALTDKEKEARAEVMSRPYYRKISEYADRGLSAEDISRRHHYSAAAVERCLREKRRGEAEGIKEAASRIAGDGALKLYLSDPGFGVNKETGASTGKRAMMDKVISGSPTLSALREFVTSLRALFRDRDADGLGGWIDTYKKSPLVKVASFAKGLEHDRRAVENALRYGDISNGPLEGMNNKLKSIKRAMYGRAGIDLLLRKMVFSTSG